MEDLERSSDPARRGPAEEPSTPQDAVPVETAELPDLTEGASGPGSLDDQEILDLNRRFAAVRRSVGALEWVLLPGPRKYSRRDPDAQQAIPSRPTSAYWPSRGFTPAGPATAVLPA